MEEIKLAFQFPLSGEKGSLGRMERKGKKKWTNPKLFYSQGVGPGYVAEVEVSTNIHFQSMVLFSAAASINVMLRLTQPITFKKSY